MAYNGGANDGNQATGEVTTVPGGITTFGPLNGLTVNGGYGQANQGILQGAVAGSPVQIQASGSDANIGIQLVPKGTGVVKVPALTATGTVNLTGVGGLNSVGIYNFGPIVNAGGAFIDSEVVGALDTVGNGTITAALFGGQVISRGGSQSAAFTDTTDTAANIIAQFGSNTGTLKIRILNTTADVETIAGGAGVTIDGNDTIAAGAYRDFLVSMNATNSTVTLTNLGTGTV